jgi:hypothetical protein
VRTFAIVLRTLLASAALFVTDGARAEPPLPRPFAATYAASYRGISGGTLTFSFARDPASGHYVYETRVNPNFLARFKIGVDALERSVIEVGPNGIRPLSWSVEDGKSGTKADGQLTFDWQANRVTGTVEDNPVDLAAEPGLQDRLSIQIAVVSTLMQGGDPGTITIIDDDHTKQYTYTKQRTTTIDTAIGKQEAVVYESRRANSNRVSRFWLVPALDYTPVRAEQERKGKVESVLTITRLERGG